MAKEIEFYKWMRVRCSKENFYLIFFFIFEKVAVNKTRINNNFEKERVCYFFKQLIETKNKIILKLMKACCMLIRLTEWTLVPVEEVVESANCNSKKD